MRASKSPPRSRVRASPAKNSTFSNPASPARARAVSRIAGFTSTPTTAPSGPTTSAAVMVTSPVPLPMSSTLIPRPRPPC